MSNPVLDPYRIDDYHESNLVNNYQIRSGQFILPVADSDISSDDSVVVVKAHRGYRVRELSFKSLKRGSPPVIPKPTDEGTFKFINGSVMMPHPTVTADGGFLWAAETLYTFVEKTSDPITSGFVIGSMPWAYQKQLDNLAIASYFIPGTPKSVIQAGQGPKVGYVLAIGLNSNQANWSYTEPSYFPTNLLSGAMVVGPDAYPQQV